MARSDKHLPVPPAPPRLARERATLGAEELELLDDRPEITEVALSGDALAGRDLSGSSWQDVEATDLDLSGATLEHASLMDVAFTRSDLANVALRGSAIVRASFVHGRTLGFGIADGRMQDVTFDETQLDLANFRFAKLACVVFRGCRMHEADFSSAELKSVVFDHCDLSGADFSRATFERCEMRGCTLDRAKGMVSFAGISMPWPDVIDLAPLLAAAVGIHVLEGEGHDPAEP
ncbi:MAG: pentapeptide repeat-containing protein [Thermoleophilia bacterium]|nr:pentapeptide repeat-containing protein [Thermoleophilia bacterium]MCZ4496547.1 pentapeptide repeat-containing protein [Thermoleophilia bacterium]